jgi:alpha-L-fucosidase 2
MVKKKFLKRVIKTVIVFVMALAFAACKSEPVGDIKSNLGDPNFHIYLCFGQSNMAGDNNSPIPAEDKVGVDERFQVLAAVDFPALGRTKGNWYTAVPPLARPNTGLNPADYFGRTMVAHLPENIKVGIINVSVEGCDIVLFDKDKYQTYVSTNPQAQQQWMKNIIAQYGGDPYGRLVELAKIAQESGVIKGILLHQGETNNGQTDWPQKVKVVYDNLVKDLKLDKSIPLLAGELTYLPNTTGMNAIINTLPTVIPSAHVISADGCEINYGNTGGAHFTPAGYTELGKRYARTMLEIQGIALVE